jgi:hypothetical protein
MKYRPSARVIWLAIPLLALLIMVAGMWLAGKSGGEDISTRGAKAPEEKSFSVNRPETWPAAFNRPRYWLDDGMDALMASDLNPWKQHRHQFGQRLHELKHSDKTEDLAEYQRLLRLGKEWYDRILARYPDLALPPGKNVPEERNALHHWQELAKRLTGPNPGSAADLGLPKELTDHFRTNARHSKPWDSQNTQTWLDANRAVIEEIRAIGLMPESSGLGLPPGALASVSFSLSLDSAKALLMDARLAAEQGDIHRALESVHAASGLAGHLRNSEAPTFMASMIAANLQRQIEIYAISNILPALPAGKVDIIAWENAVNPRLQQPADFARIVRGEWNLGMAYELLPALADSASPGTPSDPEYLAEAYTRHMNAAAKQADGLTLSDLPSHPLPATPVGHLSRRSQEIASSIGLAGGVYPYRNYWERNQASTGLAIAAFAILKGQPIPNDPIYGVPYLWDPATRRLSLPDISPYKKNGIRPIIVPKL